MPASAVESAQPVMTIHYMLDVPQNLGLLEAQERRPAIDEGINHAERVEFRGVDRWRRSTFEYVRARPIDPITTDSHELRSHPTPTR